MRLVKVSVPAGQGAQVAQLGLAIGVDSVSVHQVTAPGTNERHDVVDMQTATPVAYRFLDALISAPFYDPSTFTVNVREPRTIIHDGSIARLTWPMPVPIV